MRLSNIFMSIVTMLCKLRSKSSNEKTGDIKVAVEMLNNMARQISQHTEYLKQKLKPSAINTSGTNPPKPLNLGTKTEDGQTIKGNSRIYKGLSQKLIDTYQTEIQRNLESSRGFTIKPEILSLQKNHYEKLINDILKTDILKSDRVKTDRVKSDRGNAYNQEQERKNLKLLGEEYNRKLEHLNSQRNSEKSKKEPSNPNLATN